MAKVDGVIEAVRYKGGKIDLVRLYERRGPTYGDHVVMDRLTLLSRLKEGKRIMTGQTGDEALVALARSGEVYYLAGWPDEALLNRAEPLAEPAAPSPFAPRAVPLEFQELS